MAPQSMNACCTGCNLPPSASPSTVRMRLSRHSPTVVIHDRVGLPSMRTVHAPHSPSPQPYLQPVSARSSRSTLNRLRSGSAATSRGEPLTRSWVFAAIGPPFQLADQGPLLLP